MKIHCLQHVPFEGPAYLQDWARELSFPIQITRMDLGEALPSAKPFDWLVIMGGPMNVYEQEQYPWLSREKKLIENAIADGKIVLGICLGAQLIADVLGAKITANPVKEIGWFPVTLTEEAATSPLFADFPTEFPVLHWHGDTFGLPAEAVQIARSKACEQQAFVYDQRVVALQFHLEMTDASAREILKHCGHELVSGPFIQSAGDIQATPDRFTQAQGLMKRLLDRLASLDG